MLSDPLIDPSTCEFYLASPVDYDQCVVLVEHKAGLLMVVTDERLDGECVVEFPNRGEGRPGWRIYLKGLRALLDKAESRLVSGEKK